MKLAGGLGCELEDKHADGDHHEGCGSGLVPRLWRKDSSREACGSGEVVERSENEKEQPQGKGEADEIHSAQEAGEFAVHRFLSASADWSMYPEAQTSVTPTDMAVQAGLSWRLST